MIFDTHTHLNDERFDDDREALIAALPENGVELAMVVGTGAHNNATVVTLAERSETTPGWPRLYAAVGWHPHEAQTWPEDGDSILADWAKHERVKAIGEIGLDYHYDFCPREQQGPVFERQLYCAYELGLPVIIHDREAHGDCLDILRRVQTRTGVPFRGVFHCYSGSRETAEEILRLGFHIGFTGSVTFKNAYRLAAVAAWLPMDRLLIETDCPYLAPVPYRGKRNEPAFVREVGKFIAELKGIDAEEVFKTTTENGKRLFGIG